MNLLSIIGGLLCVATIAACQRTIPIAQSSGETDRSRHRALTEEHIKNRPSGQQLIQGTRPVLGRVVAVASEQAKVDIGEVQPRFVPLKLGVEKNFLALPGDDLVLVLNEQNLVVDYHPLDQQTVEYRIMRGTIAQNLPVGHERVVIRTKAGPEESFEIRDSARSKMASIPVGVEIVFVLDGIDKIVDATFANPEALDRARRQPEQKSPIKGAHQRVEGTIAAPLSLDRITIRAFGRHEQSFDVRPLVQEKLMGMKKGEAVIVMTDTEDKIIDVAVPPR
jgi:hypothetical protein